MKRARLAVAFGVFALVGIGLGGGGVLLPAQIDDYGIDKTTVGAAFVASSVGYLVSATGNGAFIHRFGVRGYLSGGAVAVLAASTAIALRPSFVLFVALQGAFGFGTGALEAGLNAYLSTLERAAPLLNSLHAFFGVGALVGPVLAATVLSRGYAWTAFFGLMAVLVVPLLAGLVVLYPRTTTGAAVVAAPRFSAALRHRAVWLGGLFLALYVGIEISVGNWSFSFLTEDRGHGVVLAGWAVSGYWMGLTAGRFVLSRLAERARVGVAGLISGCLAGTVVCALAVWLVPAAAIPGLALLGFCLGPMYPTLIAVVPRLVPAGLVATAIGLLVGVSVGGGAFGPWLAGSIAQRLGAWSLFPFAVTLAVLVGAVWWLVTRRLGPAPVADLAVEPGPAVVS